MREQWLAYLAERTGTYEYRTRRYAAVADKLELLGLEDDDLVVDFGAGMCEFGRYLYRDRGWSGRYLPVDGAIQGADLNGTLDDFITADFFVAIEVVEHLLSPVHEIAMMLGLARKGVVLTTPHTDALGAEFVRAMDETHHTPIYRAWLEDRFGLRMSVEELSLFGERNDTLLAWRNG